jgi:carboxyl-terminal processing protease
MPRKNLIWIGALLAAAIVAAWVAQTPQMHLGDSAGPLAALEKARDLIKTQYYRAVDDNELTALALEGMAALDDYSAYLPPGRSEGLQQHVQGWRSELGLRVENRDGGVFVIGPIAGSPAHRAGIFEGDRLLSIDGKDVGNMSLEQINDMLTGPTPVPVRLAMLTLDGTRREHVLTRSQVAVGAVIGLCQTDAGQWNHLLDADGRFAYVRVLEFSEDTVGSLDQAMRRVHGMRGVVLDLRDNPGGLLNAAVGVANRFIRSGPIVTKVSRDAPAVRYDARPEGLAYPDELPVVVLINESTASAAEIVAGALRLHGRAVLIGVRTRGKGCVQSMFELGGNLGHLHLTTAEYLLGDDVPISRRKGAYTWGVEPHVHASLLPGRAVALDRLRAKAQVVPRPVAAAATEPAENIVQQMLTLDTQLAQAVQLLREPQEMRLLLRQAAAERARAASAPASAPAATGSLPAK